MKYCSNCGENTHFYKSCKKPIVSYGVILLKLDILGYNLNDIFAKKKDITNTLGIDINSEHDVCLYSALKNNIKFLTIQRKHSIGFVEFVRGKYEVDNIDKLVLIFQLLTKDELHKIDTLTFEELWIDMWNDPHKKMSNEKEYQISKNKYNELRNQSPLGLDFLIKNITPQWNTPEWGFPKGRKNYNETELNCSKREFEEETNFTSDDYIIIDSFPPVTEELIGTNGLTYKHIYYIGMSTSDKIPKIENSYQRNEIGNILFNSYDNCIELFRPYHTAKKNILTDLYNITINRIIAFNNDNVK